jgi:MFS family permease
VHARQYSLAVVTLVSGRRRSRKQLAAGVAVPQDAWVRLGACSATAALLQIDGTLITVALPSVAHGLGVSRSSTSLILGAYFATYALMLLPGGALVDRLGTRRTALIGLMLFGVGAASGALANGLGVLVVTRVMQGAGAGLVSPAALAGAVSGFPPERRGAALGIWGASAGLANLIGPVLGGVLTITLGWRADWWVLVPLCGLSGVALFRCLTPGPGAPGKQTTPILNRVVLCASMIAALTFAVMIGSFYAAEQYLQTAAGYSALGASTVLLLVALLVGAAAPLAGRLVDQRGARVTCSLGFLGAGGGFAVLAIPAVSLSSIFALGALIPVGLGLGMLFVPASRAALNANPSASHGRTSAVLSIGRLLGAATGAGLAGIALSAGNEGSALHLVVLGACALCLVIGLPMSAYLDAPVPQTAV